MWARRFWLRLQALFLRNRNTQRLEDEIQFHLEQQIADRFDEERMVAQLTMLFGGLALLLAAIGLYGVTAYTVARRTPEIGIRMALGASRAGVTAMVLRSAMTLTMLGLAIGVPAAPSCVRLVETTLRGEGRRSRRSGDVYPDSCGGLLPCCADSGATGDARRSIGGAAIRMTQGRR